MPNTASGARSRGIQAGQNPILPKVAVGVRDAVAPIGITVETGRAGSRLAATFYRERGGEGVVCRCCHEAGELCRHGCLDASSGVGEHKTRTGRGPDVDCTNAHAAGGDWGGQALPIASRLVRTLFSYPGHCEPVRCDLHITNG